MELRHRILQFNNSPEYDRLKRELTRLGCAYQYNENGFLSSIEYTFSEHDKNAPHLKEFVAKHDILMQSALYYEEKEIMEAEWSVAEVGEFQYPQPEDNFDYIEVTYDTTDYCPSCGQGKKQDKPFRLKKDFVQKQAKFLGLHWVGDEIFVRPVIKTLFDAAGISGVSYMEVIHHKTDQPIQNLYQLNIPVMETQGLITNDLFAETCKPQSDESYMKEIRKIIKGIGQKKDRQDLRFCGRVKYHYPLTKPLIFKASVLKDLPDFVKSYEYYGSGGAATRFMLVRNKVVQLVKDKGLEGLGFRRPVHMV